MNPGSGMRVLVVLLAILSGASGSAVAATQSAGPVDTLREGDCSGSTASISVRAFFHPSRHGAWISDHRSWTAPGLPVSLEALPDDESTRLLTGFMSNRQEYAGKTLNATFRGQVLCDGGRLFKVQSVSDIRIEASGS